MAVFCSNSIPLMCRSYSRSGYWNAVLASDAFGHFREELREAAGIVIVEFTLVVVFVISSPPSRSQA
jgi:hypothetical protein